VPPTNGLKAAEQIIEEGEKRRVSLRLLGGLAFKRICPSTRAPPFYRENKDIDLAGRREDTKEITKIMETLGYKPREIFNKLNMGQRLIYYDRTNSRRVDVFLDEFAMCHKINLRRSLLAGEYTLPVTELVMTKLQVVEMTEKEYLDLFAAFHDLDVTDGGEGIDGRAIARACAKDWGLYTTFTKSLTTMRQRAEISFSRAYAGIVLPRIDRLQQMMNAEQKSLSWRLRARIGEKARWYELPEADYDTLPTKSSST
jgi:hypothetical protein